MLAAPLTQSFAQDQESPQNPRGQNRAVNLDNLAERPASRTGHPLLLPGHPLLPSAKGMKTSSSSSSSTTTLAGTTTMISHSSSSSSIFLADPHQPGTTTVQHQAEAAGMETEKEEGSRTGVTTTGMGGATTATKGTAQARARSSSSS